MRKLGSQKVTLVMSWSVGPAAKIISVISAVPEREAKDPRPDNTRESFDPYPDVFPMITIILVKA
jgi:hypothetical protein